MKANQIIFFLLLLFIACQEGEGSYVCPPCDLPCDTLVFDKAGNCPHCSMGLIKKNELIEEATLQLNEVKLSTGSGVFLIEGGVGQEHKSIKVYYHLPENYTRNSRILMVLPGAGRNGDSYRDAWKVESEKYSVLILSPMFEASDYPFEAYHLGGLIVESNIREAIEVVENTNLVKLNEEDFTYSINTNRTAWIFNDLDRIFDLVVKAIASTQTQYDLFGHSAGGQILHRMAIFSQRTKSNQIIASNSGFYTLPDFDTPMPFGVKNTLLTEKAVKESFKKNLTLLIGALDNEKEQGGTLLRSNTVDKQGVHRLARAKYFYEYSKAKSVELKTKFNWKIKIIPNVGHNQEQMGNHAAKLLYE